MLAQRRAMRRGPPADGQHATTTFMAPRDGMAEIVEALSARLDRITVLRGEAAQRVIPESAGMGAAPCYAVHLCRGRALQADAVVVATPAYVTARLVEGFHPKLAEALRAIPYVSSATVSLAYRQADVPHPLDGFGFLVGRREGRRIMAATWTSAKFRHRAPADHVLIRGFVGGKGQEHLVCLDDAALIQVVCEELAAILGIITAPLLARVYRWERANPQYVVGHLERVEALEEMLTPYPGLFLSGSAYRGVGVPDCIYQGAQAAERVLALLTKN
jgi:oxygen-dependent protoporphyrinogen oxidase